MAVKGSRSTCNFSFKVMIQLGKMSVDKMPMLVTPVSDYDMLISMDDLIKPGAVIDCQKKRIYFSKFKVRVTWDGKSRDSRSAMTKPQEVPDLLAMFPKVFVKEVPEKLPPVHKIMHRTSLIDSTKLLQTPAFKEPQALMTKYKAWTNKQMNAGMLHSTSLPGGASMFLPDKPDGRIPHMVDLRFRNDNTKAHHTQIPEHTIILNAVARGRFPSKIDLSDAYYQTSVHQDDVKYNAIKTSFRGFTSQVMMQGDIQARGTFVRSKEDLLHDELGKNIWVCIDDIFVFSDTFEEHVKKATNTCSKLQNAGYYANPNKSVFFPIKHNILGHLINDHGIPHPPEKIWTIMDWIRPESQKELQQFHGMSNYVSQFIPHIATITAALTELSGNVEWLWTDLKEAAFEDVKRAADKHKVLRPKDYNKPDMIWLFTAVSPTGTGAWMGQGPTRDAASPAAFHSRKLTPAQSNYPMHQQKLHGIIEAMEAVAPHLLHRQFRLITDHERLSELMTQKNLHGRQQRWLTHITSFDFKIEYEPGVKNFLADYLSRIHEGTTGPLDISPQDPTMDYDSLVLPDHNQPLQINTSYSFSTDFSIALDHAMYHAGEAQTSPILTSSDSVFSCRPEYLMDEITSNAVTRSQKHKASAFSSATSNPVSDDSRISIGNSWSDQRTLPITGEMEGRHAEMSCMSWTDDQWEIHIKEKQSRG